MYDEIKSQLGQNDKEIFINYHFKKCNDDPEQINEIKQSIIAHN
jgi:hypothetical protein